MYVAIRSYNLCFYAYKHDQAHALCSSKFKSYPKLKYCWCIINAATHVHTTHINNVFQFKNARYYIL